MAAKVAQLNQKDHLDSRGAAAAVVKVGTGEILALASCPSYDLSTWRKDFAELRDDPAKPLTNRATNSPYAPGSTLKPATAVAALESGVTTTTETIFDPGYWKYPSATWENQHELLEAQRTRQNERHQRHHQFLQHLFHGNGLPHGTGHTERILFRSGPR